MANSNRPSDGQSRKSLVSACLTLAIMVALSGCSKQGEAQGMQPTMTRKQAENRVEMLIEDAIAQLPKHAKAEPKGGTDNGPCDDPSDGGPMGRIFVEHGYWITNLEKERYAQYLETLRQHWESLDYHKIRDDGKPLGKVVYETDEGFDVVAQLTGDKEILVLIAASPCVWPNGTPEPETD